jgi:pimeloyl-ACP methyl ester carboxylesterase
MPEIIRNGVRLAYEDSGSGGPPMLCVHGFGGSSAHFAAQVEHFRRKHRVVTIDRRGHGRSDKPEGPYSIPAIAEEVEWTSRELGLHKPVLVVHSMGAIGIELAARYPDLLSALVVLDAPFSPPPPVRQGFMQLLDGIRSPAWKDVIAATFDQLIFLPTDDRARRERIQSALLETPQHVLVSTWESFLAYEPEAALAKCKVPLLYVGGVMPCDEAKMRELVPGVAIGRSVGAGHFHQLEVPDQVNAMIERFLAVQRLGH